MKQDNKLNSIFTLNISTPKKKVEGFNGYGKQRNKHSVKYGTFSDWLGKSGIYWIKNSITNLIYIGSSTDIAKRLSKHFSQLRKGSHPNKTLLKDFNKYGQDSFEFGVYELTNDNLLEKEKDYQLKVSINELYNLQIKDHYRSNAQIESRKLIDMSNHKTLEYRAKMKAIKSNRIGRFDKITLELLETFDNSDEVCNKFNIAKSTLLGCCNGSKKTGIGFIWRYLDANNNILKQGKGKHRDIIQNEDIV